MDFMDALCDGKSLFEPTAGYQIGPYMLHEVLGEGNFGVVRRGQNVYSDLEYAIKIVRKSTSLSSCSSHMDIRREMTIQSALCHPNIVRLYEVLEDGSYIYLIMELASWGDFFHYIVEHGKLSEEHSRFYFRQLVDAVTHCHSRGVYHRDLKPENMLLDNKGNLKLTDFGFSAVQDHGPPLFRATCGSPHYCAPEVWNGTQPQYDGRKSDAFSAGVILYILLVGVQPFTDPEEGQLLKKVNRCKVHYPDWLPPGARDLLEKLLVKDPMRRWTLDMVKLHPWMCGIWGLHDVQRQSNNGINRGTYVVRNNSRKKEATQGVGEIMENRRALWIF